MLIGLRAFENSNIYLPPLLWGDSYWIIFGNVPSFLIAYYEAFLDGELYTS